MAETYKKYDLILQSCASKQEWVLKGLVNVSNASLYYQFDNFEMPQNAPYGEYSYALIWDVRDDVEFDIKDNILDTIVKTKDGDVPLRLLEPEIGILKYVGEEKKITSNIYKNKNTDFYYRKKK